MPPQYRLMTTRRIEAFSDGVFAIAITLLVLDLKTPLSAGHFPRELLGQWPSYLAYVAAFSVLGLVWLSHHDLFSRIERVNAPLLLRNLLVLFVASVFSFPTAVLAGAFSDGNRTDEIVAVGIYSGASIALALAWLFLTRTVHTSPQLVDDTAEAVTYAHGQAIRTVIICVPMLVALAIAFFSPILSVVVFALVPLASLGFYRHSQQEARTALGA